MWPAQTSSMPVPVANCRVSAARAAARRITILTTVQLPPS